ncbi:hypothetical protein IIE45_004594 [Salmonella enterica]|nr:hypothetical protein [Salmonella enterica]
MDLPKKVTKTLYVSVGLGRYVHGDIYVNDYESDGHGDGFERRVISKFEIDIELPENFDTESAMIEILMARKSKLEADHYVAVKRIDDKISELLALAHDKGDK